jgi:hypothetical protein
MSFKNRKILPLYKRKMMRWLLFSLVLCANYALAQPVQPKNEVRVEVTSQKSETMDSTDGTAQIKNAVPGDTSHPNKENLKATAPKEMEEDGVDKDSLGYKIGYQIGSWLIPGILMVLVSIMIYRRSRSKGNRPEL